jgi:hypothetical protein
MSVVEQSTEKLRTYTIELLNGIVVLHVHPDVKVKSDNIFHTYARITEIKVQKSELLCLLWRTCLFKFHQLHVQPLYH